MLIGTPCAVAAMLRALGAAPLDQLMLAAAAHGFHPIVQLSSSARLPAPAHPDSRSALYDAVAGGRQAARLLLDAGADANAYAHGQPTGYEAPLAAASRRPRRRRATSRLLRAAGADVDGDRDGRTEERLERERPEAKAPTADQPSARDARCRPVGGGERREESDLLLERENGKRGGRPVAASVRVR